MIRLLDANALISLQQGGRSVAAKHKCSVPDEIAEELQSSGDGERWLQSQPLTSLRLDEVEYLKEYARFLNSFSGVSFYSLKGFGDVALLATLQLLVRRSPTTPTLSRDVFPEDTIYFVTDDKNLRKFVAKQFGDAVCLETLEEFLAKR
jgi:hypothetical protein